MNSSETTPTPTCTTANESAAQPPSTTAEADTETAPGASSEAARQFPLKRVEGRRYLEDAAGNPFLIQGDAAWSLIAELDRDEVDEYLDDRREKGFNTLLVSLVEHRFSSDPPNNAYGVAPFENPGDFSTPNDEYFEHADWVLRRAGEKGFLVLLVPSYLGYEGGDDGWYEEILDNGAETMREYGRYVGARYDDFTNIMWMQGGDYNPPNKDVVRAVAEGIAETDPGTLQSAHNAPETSAVDYWCDEPWLDVNNVYTYGPVYDVAAAQYQRPDGMPFFLLETTYENERDATEQWLRSQAYEALMAGAMGQVFGNNPMWHFSGPGIHPAPVEWEEALDSAGAQSMAHLHDLFTSHEWWKLRPDTDGRIVVTSTEGTEQQIAAAVADDGSFAFVYVPSETTLTVDLSSLAGPVTAEWFDPSDGSYRPAASGPLDPQGTVDVDAEQQNASGFEDWVLVLETS